SIAGSVHALQNLSSAVARSISAHQEGGKLRTVGGSGSFIISTRGSGIRKRGARTRTLPPPFRRRNERPAATCFGSESVWPVGRFDDSHWDGHRAVDRRASRPGQHFDTR